MHFVYPETNETKSIFDSVVPFAMPDSSHNKAEDCSFFNLQLKIKDENRMVYGVSYFKQIKISEDMKAKN